MMGLAVVTVASGGLPVVDVTSIAPRTGTPVTETTNGYGVPVTKVAALGMPVVFETIGVAAPSVLATLDGVASNTTLSNGNLTATHSSTATNSGARSTAQRNSGKLYFEVTRNQGTGTDAIGIATAAATYTDVVTSGINSGIIYTNNGNLWANGSTSGFAVGAVAAAVVVGVAVDLDNEKIWFQRFDGWNGRAISLENPATNTGGVSISNFSGTTMSPAVGFGTLTAGSITANFGASAFVGNVPDGFTAGWASTAATFDGTATNVTLSNGNLTATHPNTTTNSGVRSTNQQNSGKYYIEFTFTNSVFGDVVGILTAAGTYTNLVTNGSNCGVCYSNAGAIWGNGSNSTRVIGNAATNYVFGMAIDLDNEKIWFRRILWNGVGSTQNPSGNVGGASISSYSGTTVAPMIGFGTGTAGDNMTVNFGQSPYVMAVPVGFANWTT